MSQITINEREQLPRTEEFAGIRNAQAVELMLAAQSAAPRTVTCSYLSLEAQRVAASLARAKKRGLLDFSRRQNTIEVKWLVGK